MSREIPEKANDAVNQLFEFSDFKLEDLVRFAENGHGFSGDDGHFGLTYPNDREEYEILHEGCQAIPEGKIELTYWTGESTGLLVDLTWYLEKLNDHLVSKGEKSLSSRVLAVLSKTNG